MTLEYNTIDISVITIVKNNEMLLPRAIESVLIQTFCNYEYIIINDGSHDGTYEIINTYAKNNRHIKTKHLTHTIGRASARNMGLYLARGHYILFLDSDDYLPPNALKDLHWIAKLDNVDIVFSGIKAFEKDTGNFIKYHYTDNFINHERHKFSIDEYPDLINNHTIIGRLYKTKFLKFRNIKFGKNRKNGEDVTFSFYTLFYADSITMIPQKKLYYYNIGNFIGNANKSKVCDARDNVIETLLFAKKYGSKKLTHKVEEKAAIFAGELKRATVVYGIGQNLKEFLPSLVPLVEGIPNDVLNSLSSYHKNFAKALAAHDFNYALLLFKKYLNN